MRLRVRSLPASADAPPPELRIGTCIEVWSAENCEGWPPAFSAWRRHRAARQAWADHHGLSVAEMCRLMPAGRPWSVELARGEVEERLARACVTVADIPALRSAAAYLAVLS